MDNTHMAIVVPTSRRLQRLVEGSDIPDIGEILAEAIDIAWYDTDRILDDVVWANFTAGAYPGFDHEALTTLYRLMVEIVREDLFDKIDDIDNYMYASECYEMAVHWHQKHWVVTIYEPDYH